MNGTGRVNTGQGAVMTMQGVGAALSPALGGWLVQALGFRATFITLGSFSLVSLCLWLAFARLLKGAGAGAFKPAATAGTT
jgi:MFS family permease